MSKNFRKISNVLANPRTELHQALGLSGCELSVNNLPAGAAVPFVHSHNENEELYVVLDGEGKLYLDGEVIDIKKGDAFRIDPAGKRAITAASASPISFICIQTRAGSLQKFTADDAFMEKEKAPWHK